MSLTMLDKVTIPPDVMARVVGDELVILSLSNGAYFGLDPVGARIWQLMAEGQMLAQVRDVMLAEYEVSPEDLERDLDRLLGELIDLKLIQLAA